MIRPETGSKTPIGGWSGRREVEDEADEEGDGGEAPKLKDGTLECRATKSEETGRRTQQASAWSADVYRRRLMVD